MMWEVVMMMMKGKCVFSMVEAYLCVLVCIRLYCLFGFVALATITKIFVFLSQPFTVLRFK